MDQLGKTVAGSPTIHGAAHLATADQGARYIDQDPSLHFPTYSHLMACQEAPGLVIEKDRLKAIGGTFLGIIGDQNHTFGYHLCSPPAGDYSTQGIANWPVGSYACAIDIGADWAASRQWLAWLIAEIREDRITGIAEVIGSLDGKTARYWSDSETPEWQQEGVPYDGDGHVAWAHVAIYRSTAKQDHGILKGWGANGQTGSGGVSTGDEDFVPYGRPKDGGGRNVGTLAADVWGQEVLGRSPYDGAKSIRTQQLDRIETAIGKLGTATVDIPALVGALTPVIAQIVRNELAKLTMKAVQ